MAESPSHRFGQVVGNLLEEILLPLLIQFTSARGLYLDRHGKRVARPGKKVCWEDKYGNKHDLDFVIERDGSSETVGKPVAFIEAAWRRYTKHSRNKAQEIQGAVLPVAEKYPWDTPFLGSVLAGVFTDGSVNQMKSVGFKVLLFPYDTIVDAFQAVGINARFDESTLDHVFAQTVSQIEGLSVASRDVLKKHLLDANRAAIEEFLDSLSKRLDRAVEQVLIVPLSGTDHAFESVSDALDFINEFDEAEHNGQFRKYELIVRYSNGDRIDATFSDKAGAKEFLAYVSEH